MNNEYEIRQCWVEGDSCHRILYRYFLTEGDKIIDYNDFFVNVKVYGIKILSQKVEDDKLVDIYEEYIECLSNNKEKVVDLLDYIANKSVSPYHAVDILGSYADEWVDDFDKLLKQKFKEFAIA
ncbi:hypothetical protein ABG79_00932 [Caloramator mitchellensis]|uniref:Uncharacterized protein n=1 Tax=Caloramator mitchellensis TaxID=908809 RepID=A0A0R3K0U4_CALMK|nr:DUF6514 family protein [Caloramator mitchellensis]KRQ87134.1 hypothetical protein ABG79_00932 [Caloramator mitchellensis]